MLPKLRKYRLPSFLVLLACSLLGIAPSSSDPLAESTEESDSIFTLNPQDSYYSILTKNYELRLYKDDLKLSTYRDGELVLATTGANLAAGEFRGFSVLTNTKSWKSPLKIESVEQNEKEIHFHFKNSEEDLLTLTISPEQDSYSLTLYAEKNYEEIAINYDLQSSAHWYSVTEEKYPASSAEIPAWFNANGIGVFTDTNSPRKEIINQPNGVFSFRAVQLDPKTYENKLFRQSILVKKSLNDAYNAWINISELTNRPENAWRLDEIDRSVGDLHEIDNPTPLLSASN